jgi:hypothetical protein
MSTNDYCHQCEQKQKSVDNFIIFTETDNNNKTHYLIQCSICTMPYNIKYTRYCQMTFLKSQNINNIFPAHIECAKKKKTIKCGRMF